MSQLFPDTGNQVFPEPVMVGSFSSSSRIRLLLPQNGNLLEQLTGLTLVDWFFIPLRPLDGWAWSYHWKAFPLVLNIEPLGFLFDYLIAKPIGDINFIFPLSKLKTRTAYYI